MRIIKHLKMNGNKYKYMVFIYKNKFNVCFSFFFENSKTINKNLANSKIPADDNNKTPYCCYYKLLFSYDKD